MTNIALIAKKGGVGKSTLSLLLHQAYKKANFKVSLTDWDIQGTSAKSMSITKSEGEGADVDTQINLYDTPPNLVHPAVATAIRNANVVLVVTSPSPVDVWEAEEAVVFAREKNDQAIIRVIINKVKRGTIFGSHLDACAKQVSAPVLPISLSEREVYKHALVQGWKVLDEAGRIEVLQMMQTVNALYSGGVNV